jgi:hypothetical protein
MHELMFNVIRSSELTVKRIRLLWIRKERVTSRLATPRAGELSSISNLDPFKNTLLRATAVTEAQMPIN